MKHLEPGLIDVHMRKGFQAIKQMQPDANQASVSTPIPVIPWAIRGHSVFQGKWWLNLGATTCNRSTSLAYQGM
jgi:hypothetical protein